MTEQDIVQLFARFQARYGHKWTSQQTTPDMVRLAVAEWADGLADLGADRLRHGLASWDGDWPPSLPEFRRACLGAADLPTTNDGWLAHGRRIGCLPAPGEEWPGYIARVKRATQAATRPGGSLAAANDSPQLAGPRKVLSRD